MKKIIYWLGFDWIKNESVKKGVRLVFNIGLAAAATTPAGAAALAVIGITSPVEAVAAAGAILGAVEAVRNAIKKAP